MLYRMLADRVAVQTMFVLWWVTAARQGDALQLLWTNVRQQGRNLSVKYVTGKGVNLRGTPYTVHTVLPEGWQLNRTMTQEVIPPAMRQQTQSDFKRTLTMLDPELEVRSIRRGALQTLAAVQTPEQVLLQFSGHTNVQMLRRYLDWGMQLAVAQSQGAVAAESAWQC
jgi:hypothetical protein